MNSFDKMVIALLCLPPELRLLFLDLYCKEIKGKSLNELLKELSND